MIDFDKLAKISERFEKKPLEHMSMRDMLKITRKLNEADVTVVNTDNERINTASEEDQEYAKTEFTKIFTDLKDPLGNQVMPDIDFLKLEKYDDFVFWGGTINNVLKFVYMVPPMANSTGVELEKSKEFNESNEVNIEMIKRIQNYYPVFSKYWLENLNK